MKKILRLTESELVNLVKRVIEEQAKTSTELFKSGDKLVMVKKTDKSPNPTQVSVSVVSTWDDGSGENRLQVKFDNGTEIAGIIDTKKMEFGDYKIIKINDKLVNQPTKPIKPPKVPNKGSNKIVFPTPEKKRNLVLPPQTIAKIKNKTGNKPTGQRIKF